MAIHSEIRYAALADLLLDPANPRLGDRAREGGLSQEAILDAMGDYVLDELGLSFLESDGFWVQEALIAVREEVEGARRLVVVEGNRRLAALCQLKRAFGGQPSSRRWSEIVKGRTAPDLLFERIPYLVADDRSDISAFLGFRHVTGIKQWDPAEKAAFIAQLVDVEGRTYQDVARRIGSKAPAMRQHYVAHKLLGQIAAEVDGFNTSFVGNRFSVMYLALRSQGVQSFLGLDPDARPSPDMRPVPPEKRDCLSDFAKWMFGSDQAKPLFTDSRDADDFGRVLASPEAVRYLRDADAPNLDVALRVAGGDVADLVLRLAKASQNVQMALTVVHHHTDDQAVADAAHRLFRDVEALRRHFPDSAPSRS